MGHLSGHFTPCTLALSLSHLLAGFIKVVDHKVIRTDKT